MAGTTRSSRPRLARLVIPAASSTTPDARLEDPTWTHLEEEAERRRRQRKEREREDEGRGGGLYMGEAVPVEELRAAVMLGEPGWRAHGLERRGGPVAAGGHGRARLLAQAARRCSAEHFLTLQLRAFRDPRLREGLLDSAR